MFVESSSLTSFSSLVVKQFNRDVEIGEMLIESSPLVKAHSFDREPEVRQRVGDYTLFLKWSVPGIRSISSDTEVPLGFAD